MSDGSLPEDPDETLLVLPAPRPEEIAPTSDSDSEEMALRLGMDLSAKKTARDIERINRQERAHDHIHRMIVIGIYAVGLSALAMFLVLVWHYITPYEFLSEEKISNIKQILFSGTLGAALSGVAKRHLGMSADAKDE